jgi:hypothetical protein
MRPTLKRVVNRLKQVTMDKATDIAIRATFKGADRDTLTTYMEWLRSGIAEYQKNLRRIMAIAIFLILVFELVIESPTTALTIASLHVSRTSPVFTFLPAFIACLYLQAIVDTNRLTVSEQAFTSAFNMWLPDNISTGASAYTRPPEPLYWGFPADILSDAPSAKYKIPGKWIDELTVTIIMATVLLGGVIFEIQAYWELYHHAQNILFFISAGVTSLCVIAAWANAAIAEY